MRRPQVAFGGIFLAGLSSLFLLGCNVQATVTTKNKPIATEAKTNGSICGQGKTTTTVKTSGGICGKTKATTPAKTSGSICSGGTCSTETSSHENTSTGEMANSSAGTAKTPVIIYGRDACGRTQSALRVLREQGVPFVYHDIDKDSNSKSEMWRKVKKNRVGFPVVDLQGEVSDGVSSSALLELLKKHNLLPSAANRAVSAGGQKGTTSAGKSTPSSQGTSDAFSLGDSTQDPDKEPDF